jgi:DNA-binding GntR family transcriptional regulator
MDLMRVDSERAYQRIREQIINLELPPGSTIDPAKLASGLELAQASVVEALKLLAHEGLVSLPPEGIFVGEVDLPDLRQLSELRVLLEGYAARLAAARADQDDLAVLEALGQEQQEASPEDVEQLFAIDHHFHQAVAQAAGNEYLAEALERFYGLSLRLWHLAAPGPAILGNAVKEHLDLLSAIRSHDEGRAERIMQRHVRIFYDKVLAALEYGQGADVAGGGGRAGQLGDQAPETP